MNSNTSAHLRLSLASIFLLVALTAVLSACGRGGGAGKQGGAMPPVPVAVKTIKPHTVDVYANYPGRIRGAREVQVRSRIEGILLKRHYNEGAFVKKGQLLFSIDPKPFEAVVDQRKAELAKARAQLNQASQAWQRTSRLYKAHATSEADRDKALADLKTARAAVKLAQANLETAQIKLSYTSIEAPLSGVTSLQEIDEGALVTPGTQLTTVTQLDPVHVLFSVPAEDALMRRKALAAMVQGDGNGATREATLILPSGEVYPHTGVVDFTQSTINPDTGTVQLRAVFNNGNHLLVPGRFVRVRIRLESRPDSIVVPNQALASGQQSTLIYIVTNDNKVKALPVELGPVVKDGRIITSGLEAGDRVVTIGLGGIHPGSPVKIVPASRLALGNRDDKAVAEKKKPQAGDAPASKPAVHGGGARASDNTDKRAS